MQVFHGKIITCDEKNTVASYLVEREGRIAFIGDELPKQYDIVPPIELEDRAIVPCFVDTHNHYSAFSIFHKLFPISDTDSNAKILEQLRIYARDNKENIIVGFGASEFAVAEGHLILKEQLDAICPDKAMCVIKHDAHSCVVNSILIDMIKSKASGLRGFNEQTGEMSQEAFSAVMEYITKGLSTRRVIEAMTDTMDFLAAQGIGMFNSASGMGFVRDYDFEMERSVAKGLDNGMQMQVSYQTDDVKNVVKKDLHRVVFANLDGTLGNLDAALKEEYISSGNKGVAFHSDEDVLKFCIDANRAGLQIALHASGDAAFEQAARSIAAALEDYPRYDHRHMILHASFPTEAGLDICEKYKIMLSMQPAVLSYPAAVFDHLKTSLGEERALKLNPYKSILERGINVCLNSGAPASDPRPMQWIHDICNSKNKDESVSVYEALRMATYYGALSCFDEKERGSLEMGKSCDLVILDADPYETPEDKLNTISVSSMFLKGKPYEHTRTGAMATMLRGMFPQ